MSIPFIDENSELITQNWGISTIKITLKRPIRDKKGNIHTELCGFIRNYDRVRIKRFHLDGGESNINVVTHWYIVPFKNIYDYNKPDVSQATKDDFIICIPFSKIKDVIEYDPRNKRVQPIPSNTI